MAVVLVLMEDLTIMWALMMGLEGASEVMMPLEEASEVALKVTIMVIMAITVALMEGLEEEDLEEALTGVTTVEDSTEAIMGIID